MILKTTSEPFVPSGRGVHPHVRILRDHFELFVQALASDDETPAETLPLLAVFVGLRIASMSALPSMPAPCKFLSHSENLQRQFSGGQ